MDRAGEKRPRPDRATTRVRVPAEPYRTVLVCAVIFFDAFGGFAISAFFKTAHYLPWGWGVAVRMRRVRVRNRVRLYLLVFLASVGRSSGMGTAGRVFTVI